MSLRPRYSLFTLLTLTALVAAGVMYFRVPHRALVSNPPTDEERLHLEQNFIHRGFIDLNDDYELEYEYLDTWRGQRWLSLVSKPREDYFVVSAAVEHEGERYFWLWPHYQYKLNYENNEKKFQFERVAVMVMSGEKEPPRSPEPVTTTNGTTAQLASIIRGSRDGVYILTERKRIFQITMNSPALTLERLELSKIPEEHVRRRIEEELSKIAQHQKNP